MRFLGSKFTKNALVAGNPAGGAKALSQTHCRFQGAASRQGKGKGGERGGKGKMGIGKGKREGREGKRGGRERRRRREREGMMGSLRHWR